MHPCFRDPFPKEETEEGGDAPEAPPAPEPKHLNLYKHRIDLNSFKILYAVVPLSQLDTLKYSTLLPPSHTHSLAHRFSNNGLKRCHLQALVDGMLDDSKHPLTNSTRHFPHPAPLHRLESDLQRRSH